MLFGFPLILFRWCWWKALRVRKWKMSRKRSSHRWLPMWDRFVCDYSYNHFVYSILSLSIGVYFTQINVKLHCVSCMLGPKVTNHYGWIFSKSVCCSQPTVVVVVCFFYKKALLMGFIDLITFIKICYLIVNYCLQ